MPSADVYSASVVLCELAKDFKSLHCKAFKLDKRNQQVILNKDAIHKDHHVMIDFIEKGFSFRPEDRPTAALMLEQLIETRANYLQNADL